MTQWNVWDWIAYGCLVIAALGVAVWKEFPKALEQWTGHAGAVWSFIPTILVVIATLILISRAIFGTPQHDRIIEKSVPKVESAAPGLIEKSALRLHSYGDDRDPDFLSGVNVWRWYYLRTAFVGIDKESGNVVKHVSPTLFISFDNPTKVGTLTVRSSDFRLPQYEVKQFTNRFAIIWFADELPAGSFEVETY